MISLTDRRSSCASQFRRTTRPGSARGPRRTHGCSRGPNSCCACSSCGLKYSSCAQHSRSTTRPGPRSSARGPCCGSSTARRPRCSARCSCC